MELEPRPQWLGRLPYRWAWKLQHARRDAIIASRAPEAFWLLEHPPVITTGRRAVHDLPDVSALASRGIELVSTERGGLATWHGPGQLIGYLLLDLPARQLKLVHMVAALEQGIIDWLGEQGVVARRREKYPGIWVEQNKICALGLHVRRGVTMHGFALNLCPETSAFSLITPCGITDGGVTSLERILGIAPEPSVVAESVGRRVLRALATGGR